MAIGVGKIIKEIFSGANGKLSAKRIVGGIAMMVALSSTVYLVIVDRSNDTVENLLTTILLLSAYLLGLPAITGIFGKSKITSVGGINETIDYHSQQQQETQYDPCENCPHNKK